MHQARLEADESLRRAETRNHGDLIRTVGKVPTDPEEKNTADISDTVGRSICRYELSRVNKHDAVQIRHGESQGNLAASASEEHERTTRRSFTVRTVVSGTRTDESGTQPSGTDLRGDVQICRRTKFGTDR